MNDEISRTEEAEEEAHILYRFFGGGDVLLYVGVTVNPGNRMAAHATGKPWWQSVRTITLQHFSNSADLMRAEREAIKAEGPLFNVHHNRRNRQRRPAGWGVRGAQEVAPYPTPPQTVDEARWDWLVWQRWLFMSSRSPRALIHASHESQDRAWQRWLDVAIRDRMDNVLTTVVEPLNAHVGHHNAA